jgi:hypothetical protein
MAADHHSGVVSDGDVKAGPVRRKDARVDEI